MATDPFLTYALVLVVGFVAGTVSGIVGTGATIILLPILGKIERPLPMPLSIADAVLKKKAG